MCLTASTSETSRPSQTSESSTNQTNPSQKKQKNKLRFSETQKLPKSLLESLKGEPSISIDEVEMHNTTPGLYPLFVCNIDPRVKHKMLFNIFSLYGNIDKIFLDVVKYEAIVYYETEFNQLMGLHHLQGISLFGKAFEIHKLKKTQGKGSRRSMKGRVSGDLMGSKQKTINKPNRILYIFNLSKSLTLAIVKGTGDQSCSRRSSR